MILYLRSETDERAEDNVITDARYEEEIRIDAGVEEHMISDNRVREDIIAGYRVEEDTDAVTNSRGGEGVDEVSEDRVEEDIMTDSRCEEDILFEARVEEDITTESRVEREIVADVEEDTRIDPTIFMSEASLSVFRGIDEDNTLPDSRIWVEDDLTEYQQGMIILLYISESFTVTEMIFDKTFNL